MKYRVGTRESKLAIIQAELVCKKLVEANPDLSLNDFKLVKIKTSGDKILHKNLADIGGKNLFIKEIEQSLMEEEIDFAVHSLKDMTAKLDPNFMLVSCLEREDPRDAFISINYKNIKELPESALIGTSSIRRKYLALHYRPDLMIVAFRGNVQTRLDKLKQKQVDATFLAVAGLKRLGISNKSYYPIEIDEFLPAICQGVIATECRAKDFNTQKLLSTINHEDTYVCVQAERGFLEGLDADCNAPIAAYARLDGNQVKLDCLVIDQGGNHHKEYLTGPIDKAWSLGYKVGLKFKDFL